jgi:hypothetical protein
MAKDPPARHEILENVLEAYESEYKDLADTWRLLETKAQALASVAGVFIAGAFGFARDSIKDVSPRIKVGLSVAVFLLLLAVVCGVFALIVRRVWSPPGGSQRLRMAEEFLAISTPEDSDERYLNYIRDQSMTFAQAVKTMRDVNRTKAAWVVAGQIFLLIAAALVCVLVVVRAWN